MADKNSSKPNPNKPRWGEKYLKNPYRNFNFTVEWYDGGWKPFAGFTTVSGLSVEVKTETIEEGGANDVVHELPKQVEYSNVTLERGVTEVEKLSGWMQEVKAAIVGQGQQFRQGFKGSTTFGTGGNWKSVTKQVPSTQAPKRHVRIAVHDKAGPKGTPGRGWLLTNAFPVKWEAPDLDASSGDVATQSLELSYDTFSEAVDIEGAGGGSGGGGGG